MTEMELYRLCIALVDATRGVRGQDRTDLIHEAWLACVLHPRLAPEVAARRAIATYRRAQSRRRAREAKGSDLVERQTMDDGDLLDMIDYPGHKICSRYGLGPKGRRLYCLRED